MNYPVHAALAMGRAQQRLGADCDDGELIRRGQELERRAIEAIQQGLAELPEANSADAKRIDF